MPAMHTRSLVMQRVPTARRNQQFIFSTVHRKDTRAADSGSYAALKACISYNITAGQFLEKCEENDEFLEHKLKTTMSAVIGSKEYFAKQTRKLTACNVSWGAAHFYGTLSIAEYDWVHLKEFIQKMSPDIPTSELSLKDIIDMEPFLITLYFEKKFQAFWTNVVTNSKGPLGKVKHFYYRREYQARGAPHVHYKLWMESGPIVGIDHPDDIVAFIDKNITCRIPDPESEPLLYDMVMKYQYHHCSKSCIRYVWSATYKRFLKRCRY